MSSGGLSALTDIVAAFAYDLEAGDQHAFATSPPLTRGSGIVSPNSQHDDP
jgi:hypothetical protein